MAVDFKTHEDTKLNAGWWPSQSCHQSLDWMLLLKCDFFFEEIEHPKTEILPIIICILDGSYYCFITDDSVLTNYTRLSLDNMMKSSFDYYYRSFITDLDKPESEICRLVWTF